MIYRARLNRDADGAWIASAVELPHCWSRAATRDEALHKLRNEIRYRIELCPCSSVGEEFVEVELVAAEAAAGSRAPVPGTVPPGGAIAESPPEVGSPRRRGWRRWDD